MFQPLMNLFISKCQFTLKTIYKLVYTNWAKLIDVDTYTTTTAIRVQGIMR